ncbi:hypothetical protein [Streptomyces sp. NPDC089795]|uniref:hypothetical protein n=1 Tax=Streptomyces sp. NPDC089795 TaxID=3155297 RepID=UPI0034430340
MRAEVEERYALGELPGQDGAGEVWRPEDSRVGRPVAVSAVGSDAGPGGLPGCSAADGAAA